MADVNGIGRTDPIRPCYVTEIQSVAKGDAVQRIAFANTVASGLDASVLRGLLALRMTTATEAAILHRRWWRRSAAGQKKDAGCNQRTKIDTIIFFTDHLSNELEIDNDDRQHTKHDPTDPFNPSMQGGLGFWSRNSDDPGKQIDALATADDHAGNEG